MFNGLLTLRCGKLFEFRAFTLQRMASNAGHIHLRFRRQMFSDGVVTARFITIQKFLHRAFTGVVSGQREPPILETVVKKFSDTGRRPVALGSG